MIDEHTPEQEHISDDIEIFINEDNDIFYSDPEGEVNISMAIISFLEQDEPENLEDFTANLLLVREAAKKLLEAANNSIAVLSGKEGSDS